MQLFQWVKEMPYEKGHRAVYGYMKAMNSKEVCDFHNLCSDQVTLYNIPKVEGKGSQFYTFAVMDRRWPLSEAGIYDTRLVTAVSSEAAIHHFLKLNVDQFFPTCAYLVIN